MSLQPPKQLEKLQTALHAKAKASPGYRFYALYDKLYRWDVLSFAYERCRANQGAAGVDGQTFQDIKEYGAAENPNPDVQGNRMTMIISPTK